LVKYSTNFQVLPLVVWQGTLARNALPFWMANGEYTTVNILLSLFISPWNVSQRADRDTRRTRVTFNLNWDHSWALLCLTASCGGTTTDVTQHRVP
jgi:hypothetical protein